MRTNNKGLGAFLFFTATYCFFCVNINAQVTILSEDFSGGALPTGWTNNTITGTDADTWRYNNPEPRATFAPISGNFAIFDSDNYSNNSTAEDVALETVAFDAGTYSPLTLSFDHMYNYCCSGDAVVEVYNGTTWTVVYSAGSTDIGYPVSTASESIDITAAAAGASNAQVRFRFTGNYSWWWSVDNVLVQGTLPVAIGPGGVSSNLALWLKADSGGASWTDQSTIGVTVTPVGSPVLNTASLNFNDQVTFDGSTDRYDLTGAAFTTGTVDRAIYVVSQRDLNVAGEMYLFSAGAGGINESLNFGHWSNFPDDPFLSADSREVTSNDNSWLINTPSITRYANISGTDILSTNGTDLSIAQDNVTHNILDGSIGKVGSFRSGSEYWDGEVAEVIAYNSSNNSGTEKVQIESYLGLKYGITIAGDYLASDATLLWDNSALTAYHYDVAGIGRDNTLSTLNQKQSKSVNSDGIVTIGLNSIETSNALNGAAFAADLQFMIWGNNNGAASWTTVNAPITYNVLQREWHIEETGTVGGVKVQFDIGDPDFDVPVLPVGTDYYLIYDSNNNNDFTDETPIVLVNSSGDIWETTATVDFTDGMEFTLATEASNNGCIESFTEFTVEGSFDGCISVHAEDIDEDGDMDLLATALDAYDITWWENDGSENFTEHTIDAEYRGASSVYTEDIDDDGDIDILGASLWDNEITWWENDGSENFTEHTIDAAYDGAHSVFPADVDGDNDMDIVGGAFFDDDVTWWENDGSENFTKHTIDGDFDGTRQVFAIDLNEDGDMDILAAGYFENEITWWENDGSENFTERVISSTYTNARSVFVIDVDGDSDLDVLGAGYGVNDITWWENDGSENFTEHTIDGAYGGAGAISAADMDNDGDIDVLGVAIDDNEVTWWENDGAENFTERTLSSAYTGAYYIYPADVNGDGYLDLVTGARFADDVTWWEQSGCPTCKSVIMNRHIGARIQN